MSLAAKACLSLILLSALSPLVAAVIGRSEADEPVKKTSVLRHVVFFKFKPGTDEAKLKEIVDGFRALPSKIDVIQGFEYGTDVGVENLSKGFTHCFFVTFADEKGRDAYLPHPAHQAFVTLVKPHLDDVCVVDYWTKE
jgi:hypothetical protein